MKNTTKRLLAGALSLLMTTASLATQAFADSDPAPVDVIYGAYNDDGEWEYDSSSDGTLTAKNGAILLSKTAEATENPNEYDITLEVQLQQTSTTTQSSAATSLVFDLSGSMNYCAVCGEEFYSGHSAHSYVPVYDNFNEYTTYYIYDDDDEEYDRVYYCDGTHGFLFKYNCEGGAGFYYSTYAIYHDNEDKITPKTSESSTTGTQIYVAEPRISRITAAKLAAIEFLKTYSGFSAESFDTDNKVVDETDSLSLGRYISIITFSSSAKKVALKKNTYWLDISIPDNFNTVVGIINNFEAGDGTNMDHGLQLATGLMTDDAIKNVEAKFKNVVALTDGAPTYYVSGSTHTNAHGSYGCPTTNDETAASAVTLQAVAHVYTVCYGAADETCWAEDSCCFDYETHSAAGPKVGDFLADDIATNEDSAFEANNSSELIGAFSNIAHTVVSGLNSGTVVDELPDGVTTASTDFTEDTMVWELSPENATVTTDDNVTTYTFTRTYTVTIDPDEVATYEENNAEYAPLNLETTFTYGEGENEETLHFPIPAGIVTQTELPPEADISATKEIYTIERDNEVIWNSDSDEGPVAQVGDTITWVITIENDGGTDGNFTLEDTLGSTSLDLFTDKECEIEADEEDFTVEANSTATFYTCYEVTEADAGLSLTNTITLDDGENIPSDPVSVNAVIEIEKYLYAINGEPLYDLSMLRSGGTPEIHVGDTLLWQIHVRIVNHDETEVKFTLEDKLNGIEDLTIYDTWNFTNNVLSGEIEGEQTVDFTTINSDVEDLYYYAEYTVETSDLGDMLVNKATVTPENGTPIEGSADPVPVSGLTVEKTVTKVGNQEATEDSIPSAHIGDEITWTITVTNYGENEVAFELVDELLHGRDVTLDPSATDGKYTIDAAERDDQDVLTPAEITITATYTVVKDDIGKKLVNNVTVTPEGGDSITADADPVPVSGLTVEKTVIKVGDQEPSADSADMPAASVGDEIMWMITVTNYGEDEVKFDLVDALDGRDVTLAPSTTNGKYTIDGATYDNNSLTPAEMTITATYTVVEDDIGKKLVNTVTITPEVGDPIEGGADGVPVSGLTVEKTVSKVGDQRIDADTDKIPTACVDDEITWTIAVKNYGVEDIDFTLEDMLGGRDVELNPAPVDGKYTIVGASGEFNKDGTAVPSVKTITVTYTVTESDYGKKLINKVEITPVDGDPIEGEAEPVPVENKPIEPIRPNRVPSIPNIQKYNYNKPKETVELEKGNHFNYVIGYSDGTVRPEGNITRAEVATIFFRLLTDESREIYMTEVNDFTDVEQSMWHNVAISTLANAGILNGYDDGSFRPDNNITRAEMAAIIARFADLEGSNKINFSDIEDHWAENSILLAASNGWINGYSDGSFRPNKYITRAETFAMINRVLERKVEDVDDLVDDMNIWSDNMDTTEWYYYDVQEATNYHSYERKYEDDTAEEWIKKLHDIDWTAYQY